MPTYILNTNPRAQGGRNMHKMGCGFVPKGEESRLRLGVFPCCHEALAEAKKLFPGASGCFYCSRDCYGE